MSQIDFRLPSLGADMESATLVAWLKKPGDVVHRGEVIASVETEKGIIDIESYDEGTFAEILVSPGTKVPVGTSLAHLSVSVGAGPAGAAPQPAGALAPGTARAPVLAAPPPTAPTGAAARHPAPSSPATGAPLVAPAAHGAQRARISPAARRRAHELGVSLDELDRYATGAIVHVEDVERYVARKASTPADAREAMRVAIGNAMARSKREIPHYYLAHAVDFAPTQQWLGAHNERLAVKDRLIEAVLIVKAVAVAASRIDGFSGYFRDGRFERASLVHVGCAIAVRGGGLVAPALLDAAHKDLAGLMHDFSELVTRVRAGHMRSGEFSAPTITVTSLGAEGVDVLYPIINPPQVAIVGAGAIREQPWVEQGRVIVRPILTLALAGDHRVTDGRAGARFLRTVAELLAHPEAL